MDYDYDIDSVLVLFVVSGYSWDVCQCWDVQTSRGVLRQGNQLYSFLDFLY